MPNAVLLYQNRVRIGSVFIGIVTFICIVTSTSVPVWKISKTFFVVETSGLWQFCNKVSKDCTSFGNVEGFMKACQAFGVIATLLSFLTVLVVWCQWFSSKVNTVAILYVSSGVCMAVSLSIYASKYKDIEYGWAYIVGWCGVACAFIGFFMKLLL
ncbi:epithelial membrane protein 2 isoform X1 [Hydra vulgaris]|uniref:epithelial membrane protein 2 isoform X1 n=1 Tax=Hydra vulgaris TaxID=6087 RepID=UPI0006417CAA|nr:epithelial membrane protein 2 [Hydra vulgaris]